MKTDVEIACVCLQRKHKFVVTNFFNDVLCDDYRKTFNERERERGILVEAKLLTR